MTMQSREDQDHGRAGPAIRCIVAPNPSMMTQNGTNTYVLGSGRVAVIDPGPNHEDHFAAILHALLPGESISHIFVTHAHLDHSGLAGALARHSGAAVHGFGPADSGRSAVMRRLFSQVTMGGGEGVDHDFSPDICLADGDHIDGEDWSLQSVHTPGHMGNHLCFATGDILFSGDHVMEWSTSLISPPDGDMTDYMASLRKLTFQNWHQFLPGHGEPVLRPQQRLVELIAHRNGREAAILTALGAGAADIASLTPAVYAGLARDLIPAANRNILAHLIDLEARNLIKAHPSIGPKATFTMV